MTDDRDELLRTVEELREELDRERALGAQWRSLAEERRVAAERLRQHPVVRLLVAVRNTVNAPLARVRSYTRTVGWRVRHLGASVVGLRHRLASGRRARTLAEVVASLSTPPVSVDRVSIVILTHDGRARLEEVLPGLRGSTGVEDCEVIVVDNASQDETARWLDEQPHARVVRNAHNLSFAAANNVGARAARHPLVCFLNDDVEPLSHGWLARMAAHLGPETGAVGAQLVYPPRPLLGGRTPDLTLQHRGIRFQPRGLECPTAYHVGRGEPVRISEGPEPVAAATAACLLVERDEFLDLGGFDETYHYGAEDVDLCWRLRGQGKVTVVATDALLYHHEGATRHGRADPRMRAQRQARNWDKFASAHGASVAREVARDRLDSRGVLSEQPLHVAITVTRDLETAGYGDWYTAHEMGTALTARGWRVTYLQRYRDDWYQLPDDIDVLLVLHDTLDIRRVARPGLTTVAWVRNWADRWLDSPWMDHYDAVLAGSKGIAQKMTATGIHDIVTAPVATNPERFSPRFAGPRHRVVFAGNYWGVEERISELLPAVPQLEVFGHGWEELPAVRSHHRGRLPYDELPDLYRQALVVVDHSVPATRDDGSLNSRVFDAISAGALVVTNDTDGAQAVFDGSLPTYKSPEELATVVQRALHDSEWRNSRVGVLQGQVAAHHTYAHRAGLLADLLRDRSQRPSFAVLTSVPDRQVAPRWGDWHLGEALVRALRRRGFAASVLTRDEWQATVHATADVAIQLRGRGTAPRARGNLHVLWVISHPEELTPEECDDSDLVLIASPRFAELFAGRTRTRVDVLLQATDARRFAPRAPDPRYRYNVAFVGNSRFVRRQVVDWAFEAGLDPAVIGGNWERFIEPSAVVAKFVPNEELPVVYSSVRVLLNDHWGSMRDHGFVANRVFDALACGAVVVSDDLPELNQLFGDVVATCRSATELGERVRGILANPGRRRELAMAGMAVVRRSHTFDHRVAELLGHLEPALRARDLVPAS